jgi:RimJ/RimL family protein N-acetyltransferase
MPSALFTSDRLSIRKFTLDDAPFIFELLNEPDWIKFIGDRHIKTPEDAKNYIVNVLFSIYRKYDFGPYLIALKENEKPVGMTSLIKRDALSNVDLGFAFLKKYRAQGYAFEAVKATQNYAHNTLGIVALLAITNPDNAASVHLLKKSGFVFDKKIRLPGESEDLLLFAETLNLLT